MCNFDLLTTDQGSFELAAFHLFTNVVPNAKPSNGTLKGQQQKAPTTNATFGGIFFKEMTIPSYLVLRLDDVLFLVVGHGEEWHRLGHPLHLAPAELLFVAVIAAVLSLPHGDAFLHVLDNPERDVILLTYPSCSWHHLLCTQVSWLHLEFWLF